MKNAKDNQTEREKRVKVGFNPDEYLELQRAAGVRNISMSDLLRLKFFNDESEPSTPSDRPSLQKIDHTLENLCSHISKIESVLRLLIVNTAISRGHASGVLELAPKGSQEVLHKRIVESRDLQKKLFFEIYPEMRETEK